MKTTYRLQNSRHIVGLEKRYRSWVKVMKVDTQTGHLAEAHESQIRANEILCILQFVFGYTAQDLARVERYEV